MKDRRRNVRSKRDDRRRTSRRVASLRLDKVYLIDSDEILRAVRMGEPIYWAASDAKPYTLR